MIERKCPFSKSLREKPAVTFTQLEAGRGTDFTCIPQISQESVGKVASQKNYHNSYITTIIITLAKKMKPLIQFPLTY